MSMSHRSPDEAMGDYNSMELAKLILSLWLDGFAAKQTPLTLTQDPDEDFLNNLQMQVLCSKEHYKDLLQTEPVEVQCIVDHL